MFMYCLSPLYIGEIDFGYADFLLEPLRSKYPDIRYGCLIEIKYIKRSEFSEKVLQKKVAEAKSQITIYENDPKLLERFTSGKVLKLVLVFNVWELVYKENL